MLNRIIPIIKRASRIAILPHISADGDALGSSIALALAIKKLGKTADVYMEEEIPQVYSFLPGRQFVEVYTTRPSNYELVVALDCGDAGRLGYRSEIFEGAANTVNIDHHNTNTEFAVHNYVDTKSSAVGEIIYQLIGIMGLEIDREIATCIYVAIATDTGGFRYSNTTSLTHHIVSELINKGVNVADISQRVFDTTSYEKVKLLGAAIDAIELMENGKVAFIGLTNEAIRKTGAKEEDCDGIVNIGRNIRGVKVAAMFRQWDNGEVKVNLRSSSDIDVSAIANMYSGGGHKKAAGYTVKGNLEEVKKRLLDDIREVL
jgi:Exopolyphosphatase-related proteins